MKDGIIKFSDIEWGEDEARNDDSLDNYFVEFPGFDDILSGKKRYVVGRKGSGKSAILKKIRLQAESEPCTFYMDISLRDFPLNDFKSLGEKRLQDKSKYVSAWEFLLLTEIARLIISDNSVNGTNELHALKKFLNENFPDEISIAETITCLKNNKNKISMGFSAIYADHSEEKGSEVRSSIHYSKAVKKLEDFYRNIQTDSTFFLLIDELDEGYRARDSNLNLVILALLRATDEMFNFFRSCGIKVIPVLVLRSDIFDSLEDNDLNKLDDHVLRLNWTTNENSPWSLKQIAEKRIEATVKERFPEIKAKDYWRLVADEDIENNGIGKNELWQYMCILTFSRPRDIIKLLKYCSKNIKDAKLTKKDVENAEIEYSDWFFREFRDEVQSFLPCWQGALNCITEVAKGKEKIAVLLDRFAENQDIKIWCRDNKKEPMDVLRILFNYSVIGCINAEGRWIFKYKDDYFNFMSSYPSYCVHYGFCRKLRIPRSYDRQIIETYRSYK